MRERGKHTCERRAHSQRPADRSAIADDHRRQSHTSQPSPHRHTAVSRGLASADCQRAVVTVHADTHQRTCAWHWPPTRCARGKRRLTTARPDGPQSNCKTSRRLGVGHAHRRSQRSVPRSRARPACEDRTPRRAQKLFSSKEAIMEPCPSRSCSPSSAASRARSASRSRSRSRLAAASWSLKRCFARASSARRCCCASRWRCSETSRSRSMAFFLF
mmetsp:Transcript_2974/g.4903  ORF Transcript_2974/g.4903 Transcript_2974/m.4903 type:complete len:217 (+) Transcript_2974:134-784(+)